MITGSFLSASDVLVRAGGRDKHQPRTAKSLKVPSRRVIRPSRGCRSFRDTIQGLTIVARCTKTMLAPVSRRSRTRREDATMSAIALLGLDPVLMDQGTRVRVTDSMPANRIATRLRSP